MSTHLESVLNPLTVASKDGVVPNSVEFLFNPIKQADKKQYRRRRCYLAGNLCLWLRSRVQTCLGDSDNGVFSSLGAGDSVYVDKRVNGSMTIALTLNGTISLVYESFTQTV